MSEYHLIWLEQELKWGLQFSLQESKSETWQFQVENDQLMEIAHTQEVIIAPNFLSCVR